MFHNDLGFGIADWGFPNKRESFKIPNPKLLCLSLQIYR